MTAEILRRARQLADDVLAPMKREFVGKDEIIDLFGVCLLASENLFILGPPGTAKSALVHALARRLRGRTFDYLLTRFTEPSELFGPFDIRRLREGELVTNTEGMLPEASLVFLDELLNANSAILNSLLMALNERVFRRGRETRPLAATMFVAASNHLPEDDALRALFDRFLLRVPCGPVAAEELGAVLDAGWRLEHGGGEDSAATLGFEDVQALQKFLPEVNLAPVREAYLALIGKLRGAGIGISDRRAVKLQRVVAASALLCGRNEARVSDLWVVRYVWDREEQREPIAALVTHALAPAEPAAGDHPRARQEAPPDPEALAADLRGLEGELASVQATAGALSAWQDRLALLESRIAWVVAAEARDFLQGRVRELRDRAGAAA
ncbi:MAG: AAA family ATPase [Verrucomicrobia bacterium]|nr:AAA family ATPase [Verrucomicrobiota bacterium]